MKVFTSFMFSLLLVVVGGWTVVGMQEGQKAYQQHQQSLSSLRAVSAERDHLASQATDLEAKLVDVSEQLGNEQLAVRDTTRELGMANATIADLRIDVRNRTSELANARAAQQRLADEFRTICETVDRLQAERAELAAK